MLEITKITENHDKTLITCVTDDKLQTMVSKLEFYQYTGDNKDHRK